MKEMKAIVITEYGEPEVLRIQPRQIPEATEGTAIVRVRAFGLNHAEAYFRRGLWGEVAKVSGIEAAGEIDDPGTTGLRRGQRVFALMGGMGRSIDGSYAEYVRVPAANIVAFESKLGWSELAAIPESYGTAWAFLRDMLETSAGQVVLVRGGTSALGQAAVNVARGLGARVLATTRAPSKAQLLEALGAEPLIERPDLSVEVRRRFPQGVDAILDVVGATTVADSLRMARYRGRVAMAGFLGGGVPLTLDPLTQLPSGVSFSFFASAFMFGGEDFPLSRIPFADLVEKAERGVYRATPAHVFDFSQIVEAHRLMESGNARGKIVVRTSDA